MDVVCLLAPHFAVQIERGRRPELVGRPVILVNRDRTVLDACTDRGIQPGMPLHEAVGRCKDATVVEADLVFYRESWGRVLDSLEERSPVVEDMALGQACIDASGMEKLYGSKAKLAVAVLNAAPSWLQMRVGLGPGKFIALVAATRAELGSARCVETDVKTFLREANVSLLPVSWEMTARLQGFGLKTLGHVADVGLGPMQAEFGPEGKLAWELATGRDKCPLAPRAHQEKAVASLTFPAPTATLPTVLLGAERLLSRAFRDTTLRGRAARMAIYEGQVQDSGTWRKRVAFWPPAPDAVHAAGPVKRALSSVILPGPLETLHLTLSGFTRESARQGSLFPEARQREQLREALAQMEIVMGDVPVYKLREVESWSRIPERRTALTHCDF